MRSSEYRVLVPLPPPTPARSGTGRGCRAHVHRRAASRQPGSLVSASYGPSVASNCCAWEGTMTAVFAVIVHLRPRLLD